ncbi:hypothetical protein CFOL_v3_27510 [Cephalotus follicularis]|uniref:Uncharacterized protein n=1 Tax=Cephalotus follicularis TaxID=3775 RepID=A0A1Q3CUZ0_CEPFO|nr:hypothetical protein CFOL_v3_27510 [Cephalotus follicularis]
MSVVRSWSCYTLLTGTSVQSALSYTISSNANSNNNNNNGVPPKKHSHSLPHLSLNKPSWLVRTESNVRKGIRKKPDPPCVVCEGSGRVDCHQCYGIGRTNHVHLAMLPKGEWPKWCRTCGGSGFSDCFRCLGTGEYRYIMGFQFMKIDSDHFRDQKKHPSRRNLGSHSAADTLLDVEPSNQKSGI